MNPSAWRTRAPQALPTLAKADVRADMPFRTPNRTGKPRQRDIPASPRKTSIARLSRARSSSSSLPTRAPIFELGDCRDLVHHQAALGAQPVALVGRDGETYQRRVRRVGREGADRDRSGGVECVVLDDRNRPRLTSVVLPTRRRSRSLPVSFIAPVRDRVDERLIGPRVRGPGHGQ